MGWGQALGALRAEGGLSEQDVAQRMLQQGGAKPSATEYLLQQVIFVVPASERAATLGKRKREADAMRARFTSCETTRQFAKGLVDVTVRDLGRVLAPQLPPEWADRSRTPSPALRPPCARPIAASNSSASARAAKCPTTASRSWCSRAKAATTRRPTSSARNILAELREKARIVER